MLFHEEPIGIKDIVRFLFTTGLSLLYPGTYIIMSNVAESKEIPITTKGRKD